MLFNADPPESPKLPELTPTEVAQAWQGFRKWCVERAIDAKATAATGDIVSTAQVIAAYVITKDEFELPKKEKEE